jgi:hypothetical protein
LLAVAVLGAGCYGPKRQSDTRPTLRFQFVCEGGRESIRQPRNLDVHEYSAAVGESFGGEKPPCCAGDFILLAITGERQALVQYPGGLDVMQYWDPSPRPFQKLERGPGPDTLTITTAWRHFTTRVIDGGCYVSVRVMRQPNDSAAWAERRRKADATPP